jgi:2-dehydropantoate 2-reductase
MPGPGEACLAPTARRERKAARGVRICIVGCGAVGSIFAANLALLEGVEVWAYDVSREHVDAINRDGLRLSGVADLVGPVRATSDPTELPPARYGIVATKGMHTRSAIEAAAAAFADEGAVVSVQNGLGNEEVVAEQVERVMRGTTFPAGHLVAPGHVSWETSGDTWIGPFEPRPAPMALVGELAEILSRAGLPTTAHEDARGAQWNKAIFNASTNPVAALTLLTHGALTDFAPTRRLVSSLIEEGRAVAAALGIELMGDPEEMVEHAARVVHGHRPSMLQDVLAQRETEVEFLNGAIVRYGEAAGVAAPLNKAIWALVQGLERSWPTTTEREAQNP